MASQNLFVFKPGEVFTFVDERGNEVLTVCFDMDPGFSLIKIEACDTDGMPVADMLVSYLGKGYPQSSQTFINRVERSTMPVRESQAPFRVVEPGRRIKSERRELDPDDPKSETWCSFAQKED